LASNLVAEAIAREEALERVIKTANRRVLADEDARKTRRTIDLKLGEQIKAAFKVGLTAKQMSDAIGLSVPRIYQLRQEYREHLTEEFGSD
jgi:DNA-directed RNA polymerase specialized sigma subunit